MDLKRRERVKKLSGSSDGDGGAGRRKCAGGCKCAGVLGDMGAMGDMEAMGAMGGKSAGGGTRILEISLFVQKSIKLQK